MALQRVEFGEKTYTFQNPNAIHKKYDNIYYWLGKRFIRLVFAKHIYTNKKNEFDPESIHNYDIQKTKEFKKINDPREVNGVDYTCIEIIGAIFIDCEDFEELEGIVKQLINL